MRVKIVDTTLRDGEQTPGVLFSMEEKIEIAKLLDKAGVHFIEAGTPANGFSERDAIRKIIRLGLNAEIITWNRALKKDIAEISVYYGKFLSHNVFKPLAYPIDKNLFGKNIKFINIIKT